MSDWNPIGNRPKPGTGVLVYTPSNKCQYMAYWDGKRWRPWNMGETERQEITHWKKLPEDPAPEERSEE